MKILNISRLLQYCVTATLPFCLTGCMGIYEGGFECPAGTGVGCKSISEVNSMVNLGELPKSQHSASSTEANEGTKPCSSCGHAFISTQEKPEIWINPLYLKNLQEREHKELQNKSQGKTIDIKQNKVLHDTISL